jgi:hypothetical protein
MTDPLNTLSNDELGFLSLQVISAINRSYLGNDELYTIYQKLGGSLTKPEFMRTAQ